MSMRHLFDETKTKKGGISYVWVVSKLDCL